MSHTQPAETVTIAVSTFYCDGNNGGSGGHPRVFLTMNGEGKIDCPYCGRRFALAAGAKAQGH